MEGKILLHWGGGGREALGPIGNISRCLETFLIVKTGSRSATGI